MAKIAQHFEDRTGDAEPTLDRLIGIGIAAERERFAAVPLFAQLGREQSRSLRLVEEAALEIEARRQAEIGMARPRLARKAALLPAAGPGDPAFQADIRR